jgi:hypothetical protein
MSQYYGPAGIFSTDNPVSDAMQIAEEEGPEEDQDALYYGEEPWDDYWPAEDVVYGCCSQCYWWDHDLFWEGDSKDLELAKDRLREKHSRERPECSGELEFG